VTDRDEFTSYILRIERTFQLDASQALTLTVPVAEPRRKYETRYDLRKQPRVKLDVKVFMYYVTVKNRDVQALLSTCMGG
jgi:hypothetical protein